MNRVLVLNNVRPEATSLEPRYCIRSMLVGWLAAGLAVSLPVIGSSFLVMRPPSVALGQVSWAFIVSLGSYLMMTFPALAVRRFLPVRLSGQLAATVGGFYSCALVAVFAWPHASAGLILFAAAFGAFAGLAWWWGEVRFRAWLDGGRDYSKTPKSAGGDR